MGLVLPFYVFLRDSIVWGRVFCMEGCMKLEELVKVHVHTQPVYQPGKPIEEVARVLGLDPVGIAKPGSNGREARSDAAK